MDREGAKDAEGRKDFGYEAKRATWTPLGAASASRPTGSSPTVGDGVTESGASALRTLESRDLFLTTHPAHPQRFLCLHAAPWFTRGSSKKGIGTSPALGVAAC